jgi:hypothetical protein
MRYHYILPVRFWIPLLLILPSCTAFHGMFICPKRVQQSIAVHDTRAVVNRPKRRIYPSCDDDPVFRLFLSSEEGAMEESISTSTPSTRQTQSQLDPLFVAVTKMDPQTQRADTISIPIWGELILDRSLFVLLPIGLFALGGILLSIYIFINSSDTFMNAIVEASMKQSIPTSTSSMIENGNDCRGLCSSQTQDLEGLRIFMNRIGGK